MKKEYYEIPQEVVLDVLYYYGLTHKELGKLLKVSPQMISAWCCRTCFSTSNRRVQDKLALLDDYLNSGKITKAIIKLICRWL